MLLTQNVKRLLVKAKLEFEEKRNTDSVRMVEGQQSKYVKRPDGYYDNNIKTVLLPFLDYNNSDPSFVVKFKDGLPLHISISGVDNVDMVRHLQLEQEQKIPAVILLQPTK